MKTYGYGIVDRNGTCFCSYDSQEKAQEQAGKFDDEFESDAPHRVVELFFKTEGEE